MNNINNRQDATVRLCIAFPDQCICLKVPRRVTLLLCVIRIRVYPFMLSLEVDGGPVCVPGVSLVACLTPDEGVKAWIVAKACHEGQSVYVSPVHTVGELHTHVSHIPQLRGHQSEQHTAKHWSVAPASAHTPYTFCYSLYMSASYPVTTNNILRILRSFHMQ